MAAGQLLVSRRPAAAMCEPGEPECVIGIDGHLGHPGLREMDHLRIPVEREIYPSQVAGHDVSEYPLVLRTAATGNVCAV